MRLRPTRTAVTMAATATVGGLLVAGPAAAARVGLQAAQDPANPTVTISDTKVAPGDTVKFSVTDCLGSDSSSYARWVDSDGKSHDVDMTTGEKEFSGSFSVPKGAPDGKATLTVKCYGSGSASFTVSSPSNGGNENNDHGGNKGNKPPATSKPSPTHHRAYPLKGKSSREARPARVVSSAPRYTG